MLNKNIIFCTKTTSRWRLHLGYITNFLHTHKHIHKINSQSSKNDACYGHTSFNSLPHSFSILSLFCRCCCFLAAVLFVLFSPFFINDLCIFCCCRCHFETFFGFPMHYRGQGCTQIHIYIFFFFNIQNGSFINTWAFIVSFGKWVKILNNLLASICLSTQKSRIFPCFCMDYLIFFKTNMEIIVWVVCYLHLNFW